MKDIGKKFRKAILNVGSSTSAKSAFESFLGRQLSNEAYMKRYNFNK